MNFNEKPNRGGWKMDPSIDDSETTNEAVAEQLTKNVCITYSTLKERLI